MILGSEQKIIFSIVVNGKYKNKKLNFGQWAKMIFCSDPKIIGRKYENSSNI